MGDEDPIYPNPAVLFRAAHFAAEKHRNQRRKDEDALPYINHPLAVASVLAAEAGVVEEALLVAALLHDTIEDTETSLQELEKEFGKDIARLVEEVTEDKSIPKEERKRRQVERVSQSSKMAKQLMLADKICNIRDITINSPIDWSLEKKADYLEWTIKVVRGCRGVNPRLDNLYDVTLAMARRKLGLSTGNE